MDLSVWLYFALASTVLLSIPGPTILLVLSDARSQGRRVAVASALGVVMGDLLAMTISVIGLGAILLTSALAFTVLKWVGAAYLIYLGVNMLRQAGSATSPLIKQTKTERPMKVFRDLAIVTALNPKSNTFFIAFVPQFIDPQTPFAPQAVILIATFVIIAGINALVFALAANLLKERMIRPNVQIWLARGGGITLIGMGLLTAATKRAA